MGGAACRTEVHVGVSARDQGRRARTAPGGTHVSRRLKQRTGFVKLSEQYFSSRSAASSAELVGLHSGGVRQTTWRSARPPSVYFKVKDSSIRIVTGTG